ncbi:hypothetical protein ABB22_05900 [Stenotrophomonas nitritireducens]|uniref:Uncharacterized protein n=1 Tax=Stenotrophomonas nitritireducens TaxID=83617 RepID=A0ABR5NLE8_9GAMM|nr:hypothetical protein ABB22_05900 [Stenotrophomonas nitritireducens]
MGRRRRQQLRPEVPKAGPAAAGCHRYRRTGATGPRVPASAGCARWRRAVAPSPRFRPHRCPGAGLPV